ncbi:MAG: YjfB family protein [Agathobacter sp.]|nr:YjfB family protein [Agathobacter sp.]
MDLCNLDSALNAVSSYDSLNSLSAVASLKMLDNALELNDSMSQEMVKMMENSVTPHIGSNIDTYA